AIADPNSGFRRESTILAGYLSPGRFTGPNQRSRDYGIGSSGQLLRRGGLRRTRAVVAAIVALLRLDFRIERHHLQTLLQFHDGHRANHDVALVHVHRSPSACRVGRKAGSRAPGPTEIRVPGKGYE